MKSIHVMRVVAFYVCLISTTSLLADNQEPILEPLNDKIVASVVDYLEAQKIAVAEEIERLEKLVKTHRKNKRQKLKAIKSKTERREKSKELELEHRENKQRILELKKGEITVVPQIKRPRLKVGSIGANPGSFKIQQVIDKNNSIATISYIRYFMGYTRQRPKASDIPVLQSEIITMGPIWLEGKDTTEFVDGAHVIIGKNEVFHVSDTVSHGASTIYKIKPIDIESLLSQYHKHIKLIEDEELSTQVN